MQNGTLHIFPPGLNYEDESPKLVVPTVMRKQVIEISHDIGLAGHYGISITLHRIRQRYWWEGMYPEVIKHIAECSTCQRYKTCKNPSPVWAKQQPKRRFEAYSIDFVGPLPVTERGNRWLLVMEDMATRFVELVALERATAIETSEALCNRIILRYGTPRLILSDHGSNFVSEVMQVMHVHLGIKQALTPEYHPGSNMVERRNHDIKERIAMMVGQNHDMWDRYVEIVQYALNTAQCRATGYSPSQLAYGCQPNNPNDPASDASEIDHWPMGMNDIEPTWKNLLSKIMNARDNINRRQDKLIQDNPHPENTQIPIGSAVLIRRRMRAVGDGQTPKFMPRWDGPYQVVKQVSFNSYMIANTDEPDHPIEHVHRDDIKLAINANEEPIRRLKKR